MLVHDGEVRQASEGKRYKAIEEYEKFGHILNHVNKLTSEQSMRQRLGRPQELRHHWEQGKQDQPLRIQELESSVGEVKEWG